MEFGKLPNVSEVNFVLPAVSEHSMAVLGGKSTVNPKVYVGCAKWGSTDWVGTLYPKGTKEKDYLAHYVQQFNSIELNATHYRIFDTNTIAKWRDAAPSDFKFCPKFHKEISHQKRLKDVALLTEQFYHSVSAFEEKLGPMFLQLHEGVSPKYLTDIKKYFQALPSYMPLQLELRHPDWFSNKMVHEQVADWLTEHKIGWVITDTAGRRDCAHQTLCNKTAFVRFVGNNLHPSDYTRIDEWIQRIKLWIANGLEELYFFMHQHDETDSLALSIYFTNEINKHLNLQVPVPKMIIEEKPSIQTSLF